MAGAISLVCFGTELEAVVGHCWVGLEELPLLVGYMMDVEPEQLGTPLFGNGVCDRQVAAPVLAG